MNPITGVNDARDLAQDGEKASAGCCPEGLVSQELVVPHTPRDLCQMQAAKNMQHLLQDNDVRVLELMKHEAARLKTYHDWPYNTPHADCLAKEGFFYFGDADKVQCAYCLQVFANWSPFDNPNAVHKGGQPGCPRVLRMPGAATHPRNGLADRLRRPRPCCKPRSAWKNGTSTTVMERVRFMYYLIILYAVASATGWRYVATGATQADAPDRSAMQQLHTWKGVVAVKQEKGWIPQGISISYWDVDLGMCKWARRAIEQAIDDTESTPKSGGRTTWKT